MRCFIKKEVVKEGKGGDVNKYRRMGLLAMPRKGGSIKKEKLLRIEREVLYEAMGNIAAPVIACDRSSTNVVARGF